MRSGGSGGELGVCNGSAAQSWTLKKKLAARGSDGDSSAADKYQIVSKAGQCIVNVAKAVEAVESPQDAGSGALRFSNLTPEMSTDRIAPDRRPIFPTGYGTVFDVKAALGWAGGAKVRDLRRKQDLGVMSTITAQLTGDGDSSMFLLTKAWRLFTVEWTIPQASRVVLDDFSQEYRMGGPQSTTGRFRSGASSTSGRRPRS